MRLTCNNVDTGITFFCLKIISFFIIFVNVQCYEFALKILRNFLWNFSNGIGAVKPDFNGVYPHKAFEDLLAARRWAGRFVQ